MVQAIEALEVLAEDIGTRFGGTEGEHRAADFIEETFEEIGLETERQPFSYTGWEMDEDPSARFVAPVEEEIDVAPFLWTGSTDGVVRGVVEPAGDKQVIPGLFERPLYAIGDEAEFIVNEEVNPRPLINIRPLNQFPQLMIGSDTHERIQEWHAAGETVEVEIEVSASRPTRTSYNVLGEYRPDDPVNGDDRIMVAAHYDTTINTPGAMDNASGVAGMLEVAERIVEEEVPLNVTFMGIACEENGVLGTDEYVTRQKERGVFDEIEKTIIIDMISYGTDFDLFMGEGEAAEEFGEHLAEASRNVGITDEEIILNPQTPVADAGYYYRNDIPVTTVHWWDVQTIYHTPQDDMDHVEEDKLEQATDMVYETLRLDAEKRGA